ncbi:MAG: PAS domain-containing protein, partial [Candidatus Rokubacteria bacterium]|nr:PAS domain-containing protein [Candidatus Rokubacteria bacterium]
MRRGLRAAWAALTRHGSPGSGRCGPAGAPRPRLDGTIGASLVEAVENALVVTDTDLRVLHWNGPMERLTGLGRDRALARPLARLLPMLDAIGLPQHLQRALGGEVRFTAEVSDRLAPRARSLWIDARCVPLHDDAGRLAGAAGFLVDTTELRRRALFVRAMEAIGRSLT